MNSIVAVARAWVSAFSLRLLAQLRDCSPSSGGGRRFLSQCFCPPVVSVHPLDHAADPRQGLLSEVRYRKDKKPRVSTEARDDVEHEAPSSPINGGAKNRHRAPRSSLHRGRRPHLCEISDLRVGEWGAGSGVRAYPGRVIIACTGAWSEGQLPSNWATLMPVLETVIAGVARIQSMRLWSSRGGR